MNQRKLWILRGVLLVLVLVWMGVIFSFSGQDGQKSSGTSEKVCRKVAEVTVKDFNEMPKEKQKQVVTKLQLPVRKGAHMSEYAVLSVLLSGLLLTFPVLRKKGLWAVCSFAGGVLYASSDELHQRFISERAGQVKDVLIDMTGFSIALAVVFAVVLLATLWKKSKAQNKQKP